jgi:putative phosphoesterase
MRKAKEYLVLSDSHGRTAHLTRLIEQLNFRPTAILFLGDGLRDLRVFEEHPTWRDIPVYAVAGNCDCFFDFTSAREPNCRLLPVGTHRIFMTHGHRYGVKHSLESAVAAAVSREADVLLYGHTHVPFEKTYPVGALIGGIELKKPLLVLCPGSLGDPRNGQPTFATLTLRDNGILPNIAAY